MQTKFPEDLQLLKSKHNTGEERVQKKKTTLGMEQVKETVSSSFLPDNISHLIAGSKKHSHCSIQQQFIPLQGE